MPDYTGKFTVSTRVAGFLKDACKRSTGAANPTNAQILAWLYRTNLKPHVSGLAYNEYRRQQEESVTIEDREIIEGEVDAT